MEKRDGWLLRCTSRGEVDPASVNFFVGFHDAQDKSFDLLGTMQRAAARGLILDENDKDDLNPRQH